jgi:hypothetical protein
MKMLKAKQKQNKSKTKQKQNKNWICNFNERYFIIYDSLWLYVMIVLIKIVVYFF